MRLCVVSSAHGYGHATRDVVLGEALTRRGHEVTQLAAAPASVLGAAHRVLPWVVDVGLVQPDSLAEDVDATATALAERCNDDAIDALAAELRAYDGVVVDIAPAAMEAARRAGVPCVAVGNFDWAWVYAHYPALLPWSARFAAWQAPHPAVQLVPGPPLTGFSIVAAGGLLARARPAVRIVGADEVAILVGFGGFGLPGLAEHLPTLPGVRWLFAPPMCAPDRADVRQVDDVPFSSILAGADVVLTKPGYGMYGETVRAGVRVVWLDRGRFPEAPWLEAAMCARGDVKVDGAPTAASLRAAVHASLARPRAPALPADDRVAIAARVEAALGGASPSRGRNVVRL